MTSKTVRRTSILLLSLVLVASLLPVSEAVLTPKDEEDWANCEEECEENNDEKPMCLEQVVNEWGLSKGSFQTKSDCTLKCDEEGAKKTKRTKIFMVKNEGECMMEVLLHVPSE